jgi:hypothetical protein
VSHSITLPPAVSVVSTNGCMKCSSAMPNNWKYLCINTHKHSVIRPMLMSHKITNYHQNHVNYFTCQTLAISCSAPTLSLSALHTVNVNVQKCETQSASTALQTARHVQCQLYRETQKMTVCSRNVQRWRDKPSHDNWLNINRDTANKKLTVLRSHKGRS